MNQKVKSIFVLTLLSLLIMVATGCMGKNDPSTTHSSVIPPITASTPVRGYNLLSKICGIWDGPVTSTTPLGGYPEWIVDFRPISASQVSAKNELDTLNDIFMSFFIVYDSNEYKLAFRNGGSFNGMKRVAYMVIDSQSETQAQSYYRFVDFVKGAKRTITEVIFQSDSLIIRSYTNKANSLPAPVLHMEWRARLQDTTSCQAAKTALVFPQKTMVRDFASTFAQVTESIYYTLSGDPYPESAQPYLGQSSLSYTVYPALPPIPAGANLYLIVTTEPLISNYISNIANLKYRSRYVILAYPDRTFTFNYMHPGSYYLYAFYDVDGDRTLSHGDYVCTSTTPFTLSASGSASATVQIDYVYQ
jgi:hypothetical protein